MRRHKLDPRDQPNLTPDTYQALCHIAAGPITTPDLAKAMSRKPIAVGRRVAQLKTLKLVQTTDHTHVLTTYGRAQLTPND